MSKTDFVPEAFEADLLGIRGVQEGTTQDQVASTEFAGFVMAVAAGWLPRSNESCTARSTLIYR
jgi:hypothetical protein